MTPSMSLVMIRMSCRDLDSEDMYVQVRRNLIANTDTVADQIKEGEDQGNPKYNIFIDKAVKILVQKQKCWAYECCVVQMHFALSHVCHHKLISDFSRYKTKRQYIKTGMLFKKLNCRFLIDHCS